MSWSVKDTLNESQIPLHLFLLLLFSSLLFVYKEQAHTFSPFFFFFLFIFFPPGIWRNNHTQAYTQPEKEVSVKPPWETHYTYTYHHLGSAFTRVKLLRNTPVWQTESRLMDKDAPYTVSPNNHAVHAKFLQLQYYCVPRYIKSQAPSLKNTSGDHLTWRQATVLLSLLSFSLEKALLKSL